MEPEPTQQTPKDKREREALGLPEDSEGGLTIPVPKRGDIEDALAAITRPQVSDRDRERGSGPKQ